VAREEFSRGQNQLFVGGMADRDFGHIHRIINSNQSVIITMRSPKRLYWTLLIVGMVLVLNIIATLEGLTIPLFEHI
jgi:hypothetical protein